MELSLIRREISGEGVKNGIVAAGTTSGTNKEIFTETQTLVRYEVMDGQPVKGESIKVRLFLRGIAADLTPTYESVYNRFSVQYFLNLVLVDEEDRRYFKQSEIFLWRKSKD
jgi:vacuolar protein sorting-associated protein 26